MPAARTEVIDALQSSARAHFTAVEHYASVAEHCDRWGYAKLAERFRREADDERTHLRQVMSRLEYYDVTVVFDHKFPSWPRHDFPGILAASLAMEAAAAALERVNVMACRVVGDERTTILFADLLEGSEHSIREIEAAQRVIEEIGLDNYLAAQV